MEAVGFWSLENGIELKSRKEMGGNGRKLALGKAVEVGKMDPPRICGISGPSAIHGPTGIASPKPSQLSSFGAWNLQEKHGKTGNGISQTLGLCPRALVLVLASRQRGFLWLFEVF